VLLLTIPVIGWCAFLFRGGFAALHAAGAGVLVLAIAAHLAGVGYHSWIRRDGLLQRMVSTQRGAAPAIEGSSES
jgi:hypothetical protein